MRVLINSSQLSDMKSPGNQLIYIVDDSTSYGEFLRMLFKREGHEVVFFDSGKSMLEGFSMIVPNLVLTDIEIPHLDGFDLYDIIQADYPNAHQVPFIFMTSLTSPAKTEKAKLRSIHPVFEKSISIAPLIKLVNKILLNQPSSVRQINHKG